MAAPTIPKTTAPNTMSKLSPPRLMAHPFWRCDISRLAGPSIPIAAVSFLLSGGCDRAEVNRDTGTGDKRDAPGLRSRFVFVNAREVFIRVHAFIDPFSHLLGAAAKHHLRRTKEAAFDNRSFGKVGTPEILRVDRNSEEILV